MTLPALSLAVVGIRYPNKRGPTRRFELEICQRGEPVELRPEPTNKADPRAIAVYSCRGIQLGYLTAERAPWIGKLLREGLDICAVFQGLDEFSAFIRVGFNGAPPELPPERPKPALEPDFWPDDEWPD